MKPADRLLAWFYTGPLGHLVGTLTDIVVLWTRWGLSVARERVSRRTRAAA